MNYKISVLLPTRDSGTGILRAIRSILDQSYPNLEIIIIDNGLNSIDEVLSLLGRSEKKLIQVVPEQRVGIAHALNTGLQQARGIYIARMDADDVMLPGRLQKQADFLDQNQDVGLVSGLVEYAGTEQGFAYYVNQINGWVREDQISLHRFIESPFIHPSVMFRTDLTNLHGNYSTDSIPEDYELWLRWLHAGVKMCKINEFVLRWTDHPGRLSRTHPNYSKEAFDKVRYAYLARWLLQKELQMPVWVAGGGKLARKKIRLLEAAGVQISGITDLISRHQEGMEFMHWKDLPKAGKLFILSLVSNRGVYAEISNYLEGLNYQPGKDFICAG